VTATLLKGTNMYKLLIMISRNSDSGITSQSQVVEFESSHAADVAYENATTAGKDNNYHRVFVIKLYHGF
jgi:hypothetical protein